MDMPLRGGNVGLRSGDHEAGMAVSDKVMHNVLDEFRPVQGATHVEEILGRLQRASESVVSWPDSETDVAERDELPEEVVHLDALATAVRYRHPVTGMSPTGTFEGGGYRDRANQPWPPPLSEIPAEITNIWERYSAVVAAPVARARLHHLLFVVRHGDVLAHARAAVDAYLDAVPQVDDPIWAVPLLERALELSLATGQRDQRELVTQQLLDHAESSLAASDWAPGVAFGMIAPLVAKRLESDKTSTLLNKALAVYQQDPHVVDDFLTMMRRQVGTEPERQAIDRRRVQHWLDAADHTTGLMRHMHLCKATELGRDLGITDLANQAVVALQNTDRDDLGLEPIGVMVHVSADVVDQFRSLARTAGNLSEALWALVDLGAPAGDSEHNRQAAADQRQTVQFASLAIPVNLNYGALPQYTPTTPESRAEYDLVQREVSALRTTAAFLEIVLDAIGERFAPTEAELVDIFQRDPVVTAFIASSLAGAFLHYWNNDPEAACCVALPRVETLLRTMFAGRGAPVFTPQKGNKPGQMDMLSTLLNDLADHQIDQSWARSLQALLVKPGLGLNLRNDILHGLRAQPPSRADAALVLQAALYLLALTHNRRSLGGEPTPP